MSAIEAYHDYVYHTPWGAMFYQLLWEQIDEILRPGMRVLDFGSGFGKTAKHYADEYDVTAYEPSAGMLSQAETGFKQLTGSDFSQLGEYDVILLHNVLEYVQDPAALLATLSRHLTPHGQFSIVKHNALGHAFASAVLFDDPARALREYQGAAMASQSFGAMQIYDQTQLAKWLPQGFRVEKVWGLRTLFGLSANNEIKATSTWQQDMAALERVLALDPQAQAVAFFHHVNVSR